MKLRQSFFFNIALLATITIVKRQCIHETDSSPTIISKRPIRQGNPTTMEGKRTKYYAVQMPSDDGDNRDQKYHLIIKGGTAS